MSMAGFPNVATGYCRFTVTVEGGNPVSLVVSDASVKGNTLDGNVSVGFVDGALAGYLVRFPLKSPIPLASRRLQCTFAIPDGNLGTALSLFTGQNYAMGTDPSTVEFALGHIAPEAGAWPNGTYVIDITWTIERV